MTGSATGRRRRTLVVLVAATMLALPLTMLGVRWTAEGSQPVTELPASWQMYSSRAAPTYTGTDAAGRVRPLSTDPLPRVLRAVSTGRTVPDRLCARHRDLVAVVRTGGVAPGTFSC